MVNWTAPTALWLLALVPVIWFAPLVARTTFNPRQRMLQAAARSFLLVALALAIARPVLSTNAPRQSIVYLVDVSHSISSRAIEDAARRIDEVNGTLRPSYWRIVVFGATAATVPDTAALRKLAPIDAATAGQPVDRSGSDLESCIERRAWSAGAGFDAANRSLQRRSSDCRKPRERGRPVDGGAYSRVRRANGGPIARRHLGRSGRSSRTDSGWRDLQRHGHRRRAACRCGDGYAEVGRCRCRHARRHAFAGADAGRAGRANRGPRQSRDSSFDFRLRRSADRQQFARSASDRRSTHARVVRRGCSSQRRVTCPGH